MSMCLDGCVELVGCEISGIDAIGEIVHLKGGVLHWVEHLYSKRLSCLVQQTSKQSFPAVMLSITVRDCSYFLVHLIQNMIEQRVTT